MIWYDMIWYDMIWYDTGTTSCIIYGIYTALGAVVTSIYDTFARLNRTVWTEARDGETTLACSRFDCSTLLLQYGMSLAVALTEVERRRLLIGGMLLLFLLPIACNPARSPDSGMCWDSVVEVPEIARPCSYRVYFRARLAAWWSPGC